MHFPPLLRIVFGAEREQVQMDYFWIILNQ